MIGDIIDTFATPLCVRRASTETTYVGGLAQVVTSVEEFTIQCSSVQPMGAQERLLVPEMIRDHELLKTYTRFALRSVDVDGKVRADRCTYGCDNYVVQSVEDWSAHGAFYKVVLLKEDD